MEGSVFEGEWDRIEGEKQEIEIGM